MRKLYQRMQLLVRLRLYQQQPEVEALLPYPYPSQKELLEDAIELMEENESSRKSQVPPNSESVDPP